MISEFKTAVNPFVFEWSQSSTLDLKEVCGAEKCILFYAERVEWWLLKRDPQSSWAWLLKYHRSWQAHVTGQVTLITHTHTRACKLVFIGQVPTSFFVPCSFTSSYDHHLCLYSPLIFDINQRINSSALWSTGKRLPWQWWDRGRQ